MVSCPNICPCVGQLFEFLPTSPLLLHQTEKAGNGGKSGRKMQKMQKMRKNGGKMRKLRPPTPPDVLVATELEIKKSEPIETRD